MAGETLQSNEHGHKDAAAPVTGPGIAIDRPKQPGQERRRVDYVCMTDLADQKSTGLPDETCDYRSANARATASRIKVGAQGREHVRAEHHQVCRHRRTEEEVEPVQRKKDSGLRRAQQRHSAKDVRIPKRRMTVADEIRHYHPQRNILNNAVIRTENNVSANCRPEIDERQERDEERCQAFAGQQPVTERSNQVEERRFI
jgi:hypothetical protein